MLADEEIEKVRAWLEPLIGPTRAGWYAEACKLEDASPPRELLWACRYREIAREAGYLEERAEKAEAFKKWTHDYLDAHGVPHHPPGPHGAEGCRIGDRMDWLMARLAAAEAEVIGLREQIKKRIAAESDLDYRRAVHILEDELCKQMLAERDSYRPCPP